MSCDMYDMSSIATVDLYLQYMIARSVPCAKSQERIWETFVLHLGAHFVRVPPLRKHENASSAWRVSLTVKSTIF
jgi:hypothetical protein